MKAITKPRLALLEGTVLVATIAVRNSRYRTAVAPGAIQVLVANALPVDRDRAPR
jgi:hypothetical protein